MDGEVVAKTANMSSEFTSFTTSIGDKITSSSSYLNGSVEMLATRAAYCEEETFDNLKESNSFGTAGLYAKHLNGNYSRTEPCIYIELQAYYVAYLLENSHGIYGAYMGEAT